MIVNYFIGKQSYKIYIFERMTWIKENKEQSVRVHNMWKFLQYCLNLSKGELNKCQENDFTNSRTFSNAF